MVRFKQRYLLVEMVFEDGLVDESLTDSVVHDVLKDAVQVTHGDYGVACIRRSFRVKYMNALTNTAILRCGQEHYRLLWSAMTLVRSIRERPCFFTALHLGGSMKSCEKYLLKHSVKEVTKVYGASSEATKRKLSSSLKTAFAEESALSPYPTRSKKKRKADSI